MTVEPLFSPNQAILAQLRLARQASDTPARDLSASFGAWKKPCYPITGVTLGSYDPLPNSA